MFDHLLKQSIVESEAITHAIAHVGRAITTEPATTAYLETARRVIQSPEHILRLIIRMGGIKTSPWW